MFQMVMTPGYIFSASLLSEPAEFYQNVKNNDNDIRFFGRAKENFPTVLASLLNAKRMITIGCHVLQENSGQQ